MKRKTLRHRWVLAALCALVCGLLPAAAHAETVSENMSVTVIRPAEHELDVLIVLSVRNESAQTAAAPPLPLPAGFSNVRFAVAPEPEQMTVDGLTATDPVALAPGETRQYVYRAAVPLPAGGTRLELTLPWPAADVLVLIDGAALQALPGPEFTPAGQLDLEGRLLDAFRLAAVADGAAVSLPLGPGRELTQAGTVVRPTRWERLQANLGGRPAAFLALGAAVGVAVWATAAWRRSPSAQAGLAAERERLVRQIAALDVLASGKDGPPPGYEAERERLFDRLEEVARALGGDHP